SALGHKRTCAPQNGMSALPPKPDMCSATRYVRFVPEADSVVELNPPHKSLCPRPKPAIEQTAPALARHEIDVAHQFCAPFTPRQHNLTAVKRFKLGAMGDADQCRARELLGHELHHLVLTLGVERRGCFVKHDDVGVVQE